MRTFAYGKEEIGKKEIVLAVTTMLIGGIGTLTYPRFVALSTETSDGWISLLIVGLVSMLFAWIAAKLASRFPGQSFFKYTSAIATKPVAYLLSLVFAIHFILIAANGIRGIASVASLNLFAQTPVEAIAFIFLLVVIYGVSGTRAALFRLNVMFIPFAIGFILLIDVMNIYFFEANHLRPAFVTGISDLFDGAIESFQYFVGFEILLFYIALWNRPREAPKAAVIGVSVPVVIYIVHYIFTIAVLSHPVAQNMVYPTLTFAKEVQFPGGFIERMELLFFVVFLMVIFNSTAMAYDIAMICLGSMFRKINKFTWVLILAPIIYLVAMYPQGLVEKFEMRRSIMITASFIALIVPTLLLIIAKIRGVKGHEV